MSDMQKELEEEEEMTDARVQKMHSRDRRMSHTLGLLGAGYHAMCRVTGAQVKKIEEIATAKYYALDESKTKWMHPDAQELQKLLAAEQERNKALEANSARLSETIDSLYATILDSGDVDELTRQEKPFLHPSVSYMKKDLKGLQADKERLSAHLKEERAGHRELRARSEQLLDELARVNAEHATTERRLREAAASIEGGRSELLEEQRRFRVLQEELHGAEDRLRAAEAAAQGEADGEELHAVHKELRISQEQLRASQEKLYASEAEVAQWIEAHNSYSEQVAGFQ